MTDEKTLGLNIEEKDTSAGDGQPEEKTASNPLDDLSKEFDNINIKDDAGDIYELGDGETVVMSKEKVEALIGAKDNYKKGLLGLKEKIKNAKPEKKQEAVKQPDKSDFLSKTDFFKAIEKQAIEKACEDSEINENWIDIIKYYTPRSGRDTVDSVIKDLQDAKHLWSKYNTTDKDPEDKKTKADLVTETGKPEGSTTGDGKKDTKKHIIPRQQPVSEWYGKVEK